MRSPSNWSATQHPLSIADAVEEQKKQPILQVENNVGPRIDQPSLPWFNTVTGDGLIDPDGPGLMICSDVLLGQEVFVGATKGEHTSFLHSNCKLSMQISLMNVWAAGTDKEILPDWPYVTVPQEWFCMQVLPDWPYVTAPQEVRLASHH
eukprot:1159940-Pelagomonas_calceolata.AAC.1